MPICFTDISVWKQRFWGPAHEVGHCNQTRPGMKWSGLTEVTNNLTALHVEETLGIECRALTDGWYQSSYDLIVKQNIDDDPVTDHEQNYGFQLSEKGWGTMMSGSDGLFAIGMTRMTNGRCLPMISGKQFWRLIPVCGSPINIRSLWIIFFIPRPVVHAL